MRIVADASIFLAAALDEPEKGGIVETGRDKTIVAPDVLPFETRNALAALVRRGGLTLQEAQAA